MPQATVTDTNQLPVILTVDQLQKYLGISRQKAYELTHVEGFPALRFGRSIRVPRAALEQWIQGATEGNATLNGKSL